MTIIDEVLAFSSDYVNNRSRRTPERQAKIREALKALTGQILGKSCGTCYIEAIFKIKYITNMASSKYVLKRGVVLQAFGDPTKTCTNATITDELGDWYMRNYPDKVRYFDKIPAITVSAPIPAGIKIVVPEPVSPEKIIAEALTPPVLQSKKRQPAKKGKT